MAQSDLIPKRPARNDPERTLKAIEKKYLAEVRRLQQEVNSSRDPEIEIIRRVVDVVGSQRAIAWLRMPVPALGGKTPISLIGSPEGREEVEAALDHMEHGIF